MISNATPIHDVVSTVSLLNEATIRNRQNRFRLGNVIVLTPEVADDIMITADLHGHRENFNRILELVDLDHHPRRHLVIQEVCHGGPTDGQGGCQSHDMLRDVAALTLDYPDRVHFLLSNHELSEVIDYPIMKNGAILTVGFRMGINHAYGDEWESVFRAFQEFISSCPLAIYLSSEILVTHSVPERVIEDGFDTSILHRTLTPADLQFEGPVGRLVWGRDYREENLHAFSKLMRAKVLINGHTPCEQGFVLRDSLQIILDCCDENATYLLIPLRYNYDFDEISSRVSRIN